MNEFVSSVLMGLGAIVLWDMVEPYFKKLAIRVRCWWLLRNLK